MPALSLVQLASKACIRNIKAINDVGDAPYDRVRNILIKIENPDQLRRIEIASPQISGDDAEIWKEFIKRDIPQWWTKLHEPKNPQNWYEVYQKLKQDNQAEIAKDAEILKAKMQVLKNEKDSLTSKLVDISFFPNLRKNTKMGTKSASQRGGTSSGGSGTFKFGAGSRSKLTDGKSVLERARREAREISLIRAKNNALATPTHLLKNRASQPRAAPKGLDDSRNRPVTMANGKGSVVSTGVLPKRTTTSATNTSSSPAKMTLEKKEKKLKMLTCGSSTGSAGSKRDHTGTPVSTSSVRGTQAFNPKPRAANTSLGSAGAGSKRDSAGTPISMSTTKRASASNIRPAGSNTSPGSVSASLPERPVSLAEAAENDKTSAITTPSPSYVSSSPPPAKVPRLQMSGSPPSQPELKVLVRKAKPVDIFLRRPRPQAKKT